MHTLEEAVAFAKLADRIAKDACGKMREETKLHFPDDQKKQVELTQLASGIIVGALTEAFGRFSDPRLSMLFLAGSIQGAAELQETKRKAAHGEKP